MVRACYREIFRLAGMLAETEIPFEFEEYHNGGHIMYPNKENTICSVIEHDTSLGNLHDSLEIMGLLTKTELEYGIFCGSLMAEEVFNRIKEHYETNVTN